MSDKRVSLRETTRSRLIRRKEESSEADTYSEVIRELLPPPSEGDTLEQDEGTVTISLDQDAYERVEAHAGDGVPLREVIEFYLYLDELDASVSPAAILREVYLGGQLDEQFDKEV